MPDSVTPSVPSKTLHVAELFAGVGGFRLGFEGPPDNKYDNQFSVVFSNQWEPSTKRQHASEVYELVFGSDGHNPNDIGTVLDKDIPDVDVVVGGFPCQDYSVAKTLSSSKGIEGKKGVLWWQIFRILKEKQDRDKPVKYVVLENVDRLVKSPASQRGRDFAIMLWCLNSLKYDVEWRIINAADYGMPQRRRRLFIVGVHQSVLTEDSPFNRITLLDNAFPVTQRELLSSVTIDFNYHTDPALLSESFNADSAGKQPFKNSGFMNKGRVYTQTVSPVMESGGKVLRDVLLEHAPDEYYISDNDVKKWEYLKGAKAERRVTASGFSYNYTEGSMVYPDSLESPSRTIVTGEGGRSPSRFKHVVECKSGRGLRRLTPIELELLNMFPKNHTRCGVNGEMSDTKRAFFMGNALVVGVVDRIARNLWTFHSTRYRHPAGIQ
jgi:DNA (cytosine-5)-methyltransferase 1